MKSYTAQHSTAQHKQPEQQVETHLLESGRRFGDLNFHEAPWDDIKEELDSIDWSTMDTLSLDSPAAALNWFQNKLLTILERLVPRKEKRKKGRPRMP